LELLTEQIRTVWSSKKHVASVLSLDISGAFDTVNHVRLLDNLREKQVPIWFVRTVRSFLSERTTTIVVDGEETAPWQLLAGVPQGSPLSPILFLFYNALLLEVLNLPDMRMSALGFVDDINLLTYSESTAVKLSCFRISTRPMPGLGSYAQDEVCPLKIHPIALFPKKLLQFRSPIQIGDRVIAPSPVVRVFGLQLDTKLCWKAHTKAIN
jgi:hypothetical protein